MGDVRHEDTGEDASCPICGIGEYWECGHLFASLDTTFSECSGGSMFEAYDEILDTVRLAFSNRHMSENGSNYSDELESIFQDSGFEDDGDGGMWVELPGAFIHYLVEFIEECGGMSAGSDMVEDGPPGQSSALAIIFSEDCEKLLVNVQSRLKRELA